MPAEELQWLKIEDFSPGIRQINSPRHPLGTADETNTYGCIAFGSAQSGGGHLIGLPSKTLEIDAGATMAFTVTTSMDSSEYRICGIHARWPVYHATDNTYGVDQSNTEYWVGVEWWDKAANDWHRRVARYTRNRVTKTWIVMDSEDVNGTYSANVRPGRCWFDTTRSNSASALTPGPPVIVWVFQEWNGFSPDDTTPTVDSIGVLPAPGALIPSDSLVCHQNRAVIFPLVTNGANANTLDPDNEAFWYTEPNNLTARDSELTSYQNTMAYVEKPGGYQVFASLTADQLLLIKRAGGGLMIQGDLNRFAAKSLPNIKSTGLSLNPGCSSPIGYVYPVDGSGLWLWRGGDTSEHITPYMEEDFWSPAAKSPAVGTQSADAWGRSHTSMASWGDWLLLPDNWVFDTTTMACWRIARTREQSGDYTIRHWAVDWRGIRAIGSPSGYSGSGDPIFYEFDIRSRQESFSWQSQPIQTSVERDTTVAEIMLTATPFHDNSTVIVTVTSPDDTTGDSVTFNFSSAQANYPIKQRSSARINVKGKVFQVRIQSASNQSGYEAPWIHDVAIGIFGIEDNLMVRSA